MCPLSHTLSNTEYYLVDKQIKEGQDLNISSISDGVDVFLIIRRWFVRALMGLYIREINSLAVKCIANTFLQCFYILIFLFLGFQLFLVCHFFHTESFFFFKLSNVSNVFFITSSFHIMLRKVFLIPRF